MIFVHIPIVLAAQTNINPNIQSSTQAITPTPDNIIIQLVHTWIQENPQANEDEIINFLEFHLPKIDNILDTYLMLEKIINSYPSDAISYTVYLYFANISSLIFDFHNASLMYHTAYTATKDTGYLLQAAVQEFELGNLETVYTYLQEIIHNPNTSDEVLISAYVLQSEALLILEGKDIALSFIINAQYTIQKAKVSPEFLFQTYKLATLAGDKALALGTKQVLQELFPNSILTQKIENPRIQSLPLPSLLFTGSFLPDSLFQYNASNNTNNNSSPKNTTNNTIEFVFSPAPKVGYQVGAFTNVQNAKSSLEYYHILITNNSASLQDPIVVKKDIDSTSFFQIIFPLDADNTIREHQQIILKEMGIEGFLITNSPTN